MDIHHIFQHNMKKLFLFILLIISTLTYSQTASEAENYFNNKQYFQAKAVFEKLLNRKPKDALLNYKYARCCYELNETEESIKHFLLSGNRYTLKDWYLGELYFKTYQFDESITALETFLATLPENDKRITELNFQIDKAKIAQKLMNRVESIAIIDSTLVNKEDFLRAYKFSKDIGTLEREPIKTSKTKLEDKITFTTQRADRKCFSDSVRGNLDIFSSFKLVDNWSKPVSISAEINTKANENYPFLLLDGVTLYYASDGDNSIGGYDIFVTKYSAATQKYLSPENIGFPFNSPANDYMMVIDENQKIGLFATDRNQIANKVMIYKYKYEDSKIYFRSENTDSLRQVAQLKTFRKTNKTENKIKTNTTNLQAQESEKGFYVVINDSTVYTTLEQFTNPLARTKITEWLGNKNNLKLLIIDLNEARNKFLVEEKAEERKKIVEHILNSEKKLLELNITTQKALHEACNLEIIHNNK